MRCKGGGASRIWQVGEPRCSGAAWENIHIYYFLCVCVCVQAVIS